MSDHIHLFPDTFSRYIEPFLGGGAVFFHLCPASSILSDLNPALIETYLAIREHGEAVYAQLSYHAERHSKEYYYRIRSQSHDGPIHAAARLIYLNRTCWNGLYRVNQRGHFNVPVGTKTRVLLEESFGPVASLLQSAEILCSDFEASIERAGPDDFVFVDPPYTVKHNNNGFLKYNESIFTWADQERLCDMVAKAKRRGAKVLVSNAAHSSIADLYRGLGEIHKVVRNSVIAGSASARGREQEYIIKCY